MKIFCTEPSHFHKAEKRLVVDNFLGRDVIKYFLSGEIILLPVLDRTCDLGVITHQVSAAVNENRKSRDQ